MAEVFLSYASTDRAKAAALQRALTEAGYSVFWDQEIPPGEDWDSWIRVKLGEAKAVIVLWSKTSIASPNVRHEAMIARDERRLIPVMIAPLKPNDFPMGLYLVQGVLLDHWSGDPGDPAYQRLLAEVVARAGPRRLHTTSRDPPVVDIEPKRAVEADSRRWIRIVAGAAVVAVVVSAAWLEYLRHTERVDEAAALLVGRWRWDGIACGQGPEVTRVGNRLVFSMVGAPRYVHEIEVLERGTGRFTTKLVEPEERRGTVYLFNVGETWLHVSEDERERVDAWERCP